MHSGQRPITLEYQINRPPPILSDTLVTGMVVMGHIALQLGVLPQLPPFPNLGKVVLYV